MEDGRNLTDQLLEAGATTGPTPIPADAGEADAGAGSPAAPHPPSPAGGPRRPPSPSKGYIAVFGTFVAIHFMYLIYVGIISAAGAGGDSPFFVCSLPLYLWCTVHLVRLCIVLALDLHLYCAQHTTFTRGYLRTLKMKRLLATAGLGWFAMGNVWVLSGNDGCPEGSSIPTLALVFIIINWVVLMLPCVIGLLILPLLFLCVPAATRRRILGAPDTGLGRTGSASSLRGAALPEINQYASKYLYGSKPPQAAAARDTTCAICFEEFSEGDLLRTLPCGHTFKANCIDTWLQKNRTCPTCRADIRSSVLAPKELAGASKGAQEDRGDAETPLLDLAV